MDFARHFLSIFAAVSHYTSTVQCNCLLTNLCGSVCLLMFVIIKIYQMLTYVFKAFLFSYCLCFKSVRF